MLDYHAHLRRLLDQRQYDVAEQRKDMDQNHIRLRLISTMEGSSIRNQNDYINALALAEPERFIGCGVVNPKEEDSVAEMLRLLGLPGIRAVELDSLEHGYLPESCRRLDEIMALAAEYGIPVNVYTGKGPRTAPDQWAYYAKRHPRLTMVLLHGGGIDFGYGCVDLVKEQPNLWVELSDLFEMPILHRVFHELNPEKILFGTQYPAKLSCFTLGTLEMLGLSEQTKRLVLEENAKNLLRLP